ncbi:GTP-binding protein [Methanophagales archaeon]|nr:MAG: GTP-binding protein [Methanophagales archaeon]
MTIEEEIKSIEDEIRKTPYNKATSHHIGRLKAKLARLKDELQKQATLKSSHAGRGYSIKKSGHATIVMVGFPSVGKSTLLNHLTGTNAEVAAYDFTTLDVIPGTLEYKGTRLQVLDVPGLIPGAAAGRGRGKEVIAIMRNADLVLIVVDVFHPEQYDILVKELYDAGIRINTRPPDVTIHKLARGGIAINSTVELNQELDEKMVRSVLAEYRIHNAEVLIRGKKITLDELIDVVTGNRKYLHAITVINKIDLADPLTLSICNDRFPDAIMISAEEGIKIDNLKERIYEVLGFIRIYMKPQGAPPDMDNPMVMRINSTVADVCSVLHRDFVERFRYALIWGPSAKHSGQRVGLSHVLVDGDVVGIVVRK